MSHREWRPDIGFSVGGDGKRCRMCSGRDHKRCTNLAVAKLRRTNGYWYYCAEHLYGREIRDGVVMSLCVVDAESVGQGPRSSNAEAEKSSVKGTQIKKGEGQ